MAGGGSMIILLVLMGGMLFFMSRTQKKQQQKKQELLDSMQVGSKVVTIGGLHGVVSRINNDKNTVEIDCEGIYLEYSRSAIASVQPSDHSDITVETVTTENGSQAEETTAADSTQSETSTETSDTKQDGAE